MRVKLLIAAFSMMCMLSLSAEAKTKPVPAPGYNPFTPSEQVLATKLHRTGVAVIKQGDRLMLVVPIDSYFMPASTRVRDNRKESLQEIARLVGNYSRRFVRPKIYVNGYTDKIYALKTREELSLQYAQIMTSYLWAFGVPGNIISTHGYGAEHGIASNENSTGAAFNRRIEIIVK